MENLFRYDNKFFEVLDKITDIVVLNFLFIVCSIPIITIGASITATYSVAMKVIKGEESYIIKDFIKKLKENFKISTIVWLLIAVIGFVLALDFYISTLISNNIVSKILQFIFTIVSIIVVFVLTYAFPIISKFDNTIKNTMINSVLISIQNLPYTMIMVFVNLLPITMIYLFSSYWGYILFFYTIIGYGIIAYINSIFLDKVLSKYID